MFEFVAIADIGSILTNQCKSIFCVLRFKINRTTLKHHAQVENNDNLKASLKMNNNTEFTNEIL